MLQRLHGKYLYQKIIHCLPEIQIELGIMYSIWLPEWANISPNSSESFFMAAWYSIKWFITGHLTVPSGWPLVVSNFSIL